ncbi:MAG TPA: MFS transporter [Myxococcales bacterium]|nr:MFS transporter [Myxococcales bacterium]
MRRSLRTSIAEGALAELVAACTTGGVLTAWALYLELSPLLIGLLGALPFSAQLVQLPASWITRRFGGRRVALWTIGIARQSVLPLVFLPLLPLPLEAKQQIFLACAFVTAALNVMGNNAWTSWMGDLVPGRVRGRYFGQRSALCALAATCASLAAGFALDAGRDHGEAGVALCLLTLFSCVVGAATTALLARQHEPSGATPPQAAPLRETIAPLRDLRARSLLSFQIAWSAAGGIAAAFYPLHMIGNLRMGFVRMALYTAVVAVFRMLAAPLWGRVVDRGGVRAVLASSAFALCLSPLLWIFATEGRLWPLALDAAVSGVANAGLALATFSLPIALSRPATRSFYVGTLAAAGGLAAGIGSAAGGAAVKLLPDAWSLFGQPLVAAHALFLVGAAARFCAAGLALRVESRAPAEVVEMPRPAELVRAKLSA